MLLQKSVLLLYARNPPVVGNGLAAEKKKKNYLSFPMPRERFYVNKKRGQKKK